MTAIEIKKGRPASFTLGPVMFLHPHAVSFTALFNSQTKHFLFPSSRLPGGSLTLDYTQYVKKKKCLTQVNCVYVTNFTLLQQMHTEKNNADVAGINISECPKLAKVAKLGI